MEDGVGRTENKVEGMEEEKKMSRERKRDKEGCEGGRKTRKEPQGEAGSSLPTGHTTTPPATFPQHRPIGRGTCTNILTGRRR
ncbi:hypothetical protein Pmani_014248 [Petrolisthes manimaculis]|uniref:Uncharacterized protein n=1 Tax=Petrolisthes manimaculis TaxID=1843537 RepID=A0AAE1PW07_9EUCA|nr:hypothetical protein Pmani_014248 [Petrolisthes manimaculis]